LGKAGKNPTGDFYPYFSEQGVNQGLLAGEMKKKGSAGNPGSFSDKGRGASVEPFFGK
jgi:hypothetical protein